MRRIVLAAIAGIMAFSMCACDGAGGLKENHRHTYEKKGYTYMNLIPDMNFRTGMEIITQKDHANKDKFTTIAIHNFYEGEKAEKSRWRLAQWDSGIDLRECLKDAGPGEITDGFARSFKYDPATDTMTFRQDTSIYYNGKAAIQGDYWPHLLIEQGTFDYKNLSDDEKPYYNCDADKIILTMDIRLEQYKSTPIDGDWVRAMQFPLYFYVKGTKTNDFCWFGVQLFDSRWTLNEHYIGYDGGKPDASSAMIFSIGSKYVYPDANLWKDGDPNPSSDWVHIELDLKPFLVEMFEAGKRDNYFKAKDLSELCINGMNMGWEIIATFDGTMSIRNMQLTSYIAEK